MTAFANSIVQPTRIQLLNDKPVRKGRYVLYWMQQAQRSTYNHALEYAIELANHYRKPLLVVFGLTDSYPEARHRHYHFMLEGLQETQLALKERGIKMVVQKGSPEAVAIRCGKKAAAIVCDCGYLRHQKTWRRSVAKAADCRVIQVESDVVVPVSVVSSKAEYAARTIRPKIHKHLDDYLTDVHHLKVEQPSLGIRVGPALDLSNIQDVLDSLSIDTSVAPVNRFFKGGTSQAKQRLKQFIKSRLKWYDQHSNQPQTGDISHMSMYLHFGQISPLYVALQILKVPAKHKSARSAYLEQVIVRRELATNFVHFTPDYDAYSCLPNWAKQTLADHAKDPRNPEYDIKELEAAKTRDVYFNAAMQEMRCTGFMHNYMRMYWGKKILEWSDSPQQAFQTTLKLNNKYFLDGRDPNSYTGVAWIYGIHDRAWKERPIFGKIRYMAASGLERKCDILAYVKSVDQMCQMS